MKKHCIYWITVCLALCALNAVADYRVGYVQVDKILKESPRTIAIGQKLQKEFSPRNAELERMAKKLTEQAALLEKNAPTMSESERSTQRRSLSNLKLDFEQKKREQHEEFSLRKKEELAKLQDLINKVVTTVSESQGYDLVLYGSVMYVGKKVDITDEVIKALNK